MSEILHKVNRLREAVNGLNVAMHPELLCSKVIQIVIESMEIDCCDLYLVEGDGRLVMASSSGCSQQADVEAFKVGLAGMVAAQRQPLLIDDVRSDGRFSEQTQAIGSAIVIPLKYNDCLVGVLEVSAEHARAFDSTDVVLMQIFADCVAGAVQFACERDDTRARMIELGARAKRHQLIHKVGEALVTGESLEAAMQNVVNLVATTLNYSQTAILLLDAPLEELEVMSEYGYGDVQGLRIPVSQGATGYAVRHREPVNISDVRTDPRYVKGMSEGRSELVVPILHKDEVLGVIDLESLVANSFDAEDVELIQVVASYTCAAIIATRCNEELTEQIEIAGKAQLEAQLLGNVAKTLEALDDRDVIFDKALDLLSQLFGWRRRAIWMLEPASGQLVAHGAKRVPGVTKDSRIPTGQGAQGEAAKMNAPVLMNTFDETIKKIDNTNIRSEMAVPLRDDNEMVAVMHICGNGNSFCQQDLDMLVSFCDQVSVALKSSRLKNETIAQLKVLDDRTRRLDLLNRVAKSLTGRFEIDELLDELLGLCTEAFELSHCAVLLLNADQESLVMRASLGYDENAPKELAVGEGITGHLVATGVPILVPDVTKDPRYVTGVKGGRSEMAVPLRVFGEVIGVLDAESFEVGAFNEEDLDMFASFAAQAAVAIHNADLTTKLEAAKNA